MDDSKDVLGVVFNIQRFSLHDGPGIRTLVFLKGCPLRCIWCANPEGLTLNNQVLLDKRKCIGCGDCIPCPNSAIYRSNKQYLTDPNLCNGCGQCVEVCKYQARKMSNNCMSALEVIKICEKDKFFFNNGGGGLTLSGGEPLSQHQFALAILKLAKQRNLNLAIETSALVKTSVFLSAISLCDHVFIDIKAINSNLHRQITGVSNQQILKNIRQMDEYLSEPEKEKVTLRIPLIPTCNAEVSIIKEIGEFITSLKGNYKTEILPFHNFGESKYEKLGLNYIFAGNGNMKEEEAIPYKELLSSMGVSVQINTH
ncbi:glycyl-radical enzyme activating protein [Orbus sturtevantii]|uniref:glycyl-radical enzyme activating protein n=1 Tax=Orbus sturtevantii TaxID=3074109 RepID=UPI00370D130A